MKYINFLPVLLLMAATTGCGNSSSEDKTTPESSSTTVPAPTTVGTDASTTQPVPQQTPATIQAPVINTPTQPVTTQAVSKAGLNPAHGQPGHRCDISVGAPLDSKPTQPTVNTTQPVVTQNAAPALTPNTPTPSPVKVAAGMNPAHGQPGHRCDIAVGAPLNSKPTQ
jgi:hypothetical protein